MGGIDPTSGTQHDAGSDRRLDAALADYLARLEAGERPDREAFLAEHAEIAGPLAECIEALAFIRSAAAPFVTPTTGAAAEVVPAGAELGGYRIVREVGRGGMGVVYEAVQATLGRRVALKVLPSTLTLHPTQRRRFELEVRAAAHLDHPHIVPIIDVGDDRGLCFYAMKFIEGRSLADVIAGLKADRRAGSAGAESHRAAAGLAKQAAEALDYIHRMGVLHRDVKPANLLVDRSGSLWVTDFGLALHQGEDGLTRTGEMLGTLRYMSPEQASARRGLVDQRSDVYSLGVTLYELLTLRPAIGGEDRVEMLRRIETEEPPLPRGVEPSIPRDLETVVLKATAKEPGRRYATAAEMADDLARFLDDRPILARRPSATERLARWARRRRAAVATAAVVLLVAGAVGSAVLGVAYGRARANNERAREALRKSFAVADVLATDAIGRLESFEDDPRGGLFHIGALDYFREIADLYADEPEMRETAAAAYHRVAFTQTLLRHVKRHPDFLAVDPEPAYRKACELFEAEIAAAPAAPEPRTGLAETLADLAAYRRMSGRFADSERAHRRLVEVRRTVVDEEFGRHHLSYELAAHGRLLDALGLGDEAVAPCRESEEMWTALAQEIREGSAEERADAARFGAQIALTLADVAPERAGRVVRLARELDPDDPTLQNNEAWLLVKRPGASAEEAKRAVELGRSAAELAPARWEFWNTLGVAQIRAGELAQAVESLGRGMSLHAGGDARDWIPLATAHGLAGDLDRAKARYEQAGRWIAKNPDEMDVDLIALVEDAAQTLARAGVAVEFWATRP